MMRTKLVATASLLALFGCASTPNLDYYTLDITPSGKVDRGVNLVVERFQPTEMLDRHQIVIQQSPTRIDYYATDRWASSVGEIVQGKLAAEFGPVVEGRSTFVVSGRVLAFEQVDAGSTARGKVVLEVAIRAADGKRYETPLLKKTYEATRQADASTVDAAVRALSRATEAIAVEIAADAAGL